MKRVDTVKRLLAVFVEGFLLGGANVPTEKADRSWCRRTVRSAKGVWGGASRKSMWLRRVAQREGTGATSIKCARRRGWQAIVALWRSTRLPCLGASGRLVCMKVADTLCLQVVGGSQQKSDRWGSFYASKFEMSEVA